MSSPLHKHERSQWKTFWRRFCPGPQTRWGIRGHLRQSFRASQNCVVLRKICFKHMIKIKIFPPKMYFALPQTLNPGNGPGSANLCLQWRYFYEDHSASRCSINVEKFFHKSPLGGPCKHFGGCPELGWYGTGCEYPRHTGEACFACGCRNSYSCRNSSYSAPRGHGPGWRIFQIWRFFWMLPWATENAVAGHMRPAGRYLPTPALGD